MHRKKIRTVGALAGALMLLAVPATAQVPGDTFVGTSTATALKLTIDETGLTAGFTEAAVQSEPLAEACGELGDACARAAGELLLGEAAEASAPNNPGPKSVAAFEIPDTLHPLLTGSIGTARAEARADSITRGLGEAGVANVELTATQTLVEQVPQLQEALREIGDTLLDPVAEGDPTGLVGRVRDSVDHIAENVSEAPLLTVAAGPSKSESTDTGSRTTATAAAQGATVVLVPTPLSLLPDQPEGLVIVEVGAAKATATTDRLAASSDFDPALVRVRILDPATGTYDVVEIAPGDEPTCVLGGTPLELCIGVGSGSSTVADGGASAIASGVTVTALTDPLPTVRLRLAEAEAAVNAARVAPAPAPGPELPVTGGGMAVTGLVVLVLGAASWFGLRRLRTVA